MKWNTFMDEREELQKKISEESGYDLRKHFEQTRESVKQLEKERGIKIEYVDPRTIIYGKKE